jgi:hypothetical protein
VVVCAAGLIGVGGLAAWRLSGPTSLATAAGAEASGPGLSTPVAATPRRTVGSDRGTSRIPATVTGRAGATQTATSPILLFGDSLALGLADLLPPLVPTRPVTVEAEVGRGSTTAVYVLESLDEPTPSTWVVSLGTNDYDDLVLSTNVDTLMADAGRKRCVLWFDVWRPGSDEGVNAVLEAAAVRYDNLHVVPWNGLAAQHPEWFSGTDVHPSTEGYTARAQQAATAVAELCG